MNLFVPRPALLSLLFFWQPASRPDVPLQQFRYQRAVSLPSVPSRGQACAVLDADVFSHAAPDLKDLRLFGGRNELPYSTTVSEPPQTDTDDARIFHLHIEGRRIDFDVEMPRRPYTSIVLDLASRNFVANAIVSGLSTPEGGKSTPIGRFTLFDLTGQHLARSTDISFSESTFPYLHIELFPVAALGSAPSDPALNLAVIVKSVTVPPSREAQSLYTVVLPQQRVIQTGADSVATFKVSARVPIERIAFTLPQGYQGDFSRNVKIEARALAGENPQRYSGGRHEEAIGTILRVHKDEAGHDLSAETLTIPVAIGSNMQQPASIEVHVEDSSEAPPPLFVQLQMRQRRICFEADPTDAPLMLYYGDPALDAPASRTEALSHVEAQPRRAQLGPESLNPAFVATASPRRLVRERTVLRWIALLGCVGIFALLVIRATHKRRH